jgi:hypothetical protein
VTNSDQSTRSPSEQGFDAENFSRLLGEMSKAMTATAAAFGSMSDVLRPLLESAASPFRPLLLLRLHRDLELLAQSGPSDPSWLPVAWRLSVGRPDYLD